MTVVRPPRSPNIMLASIIFCMCCVSHALLFRASLVPLLPRRQGQDYRDCLHGGNGVDTAVFMLWRCRSDVPRYGWNL